MALDAVKWPEKKAAIQPKWPGTSSGSMEETGRPKTRPMASAISRVVTPCSAMAWTRLPAGALSSASVTRRAASETWTADQRLAPSPG
ncbi:hypothetical protein GCM10020001_102010 [Nonomuraea salmonea]